MLPEPELARWLQRVEARLEAALPPADRAPCGLHAAMRHAVLGGGKRLRPLLVYAAGAATGADEALLDAPAAAVELIHAFSLVHDDLPAMDDDDLRRGRPTVHVAFDEATAILAGDALQSLAFAVLAERPADAALRVAWLASLADATGAAGMCGGQALDMAATGQRLAQAELETLHALKTGALIRACVRMGALAGGADAATLAGAGRLRLGPGPGVPDPRRHPGHRRRQRAAGQDRRQGPGAGQIHLPVPAGHGRRARRARAPGPAHGRRPSPAWRAPTRCASWAASPHSARTEPAAGRATKSAGGARRRCWFEACRLDYFTRRSVIG